MARSVAKRLVVLNIGESVEQLELPHIADVYLYSSVKSKYYFFHMQKNIYLEFQKLESIFTIL